MIPYGRQSITDEDILSVVNQLKSDFLTQGPAIVKFEEDICRYTGAEYCVALANGTAALHLAVAALISTGRILSGSEGITTPITFAASSNAMLYNDITPRFADIDENTYNIDPSEVMKGINEKTSLLIPVHFAGQVADMEVISELARSNNLSVVEDAAHAIGSDYKNGKKVGCCCYSDMTIFSFHPVKTVTTGEGGAITTNSKELYEALLLLRSHGLTKDPSKLKANPGPWYYEMQELGFNYRLTDIQAALGSSQLKRLDEFKARRRDIVSKYNDAFQYLDWLKTPYEADGLSSCFHLYVAWFDLAKLKMNRKQLMEMLREKGVGTQVHYIPVYSQPYYINKYGDQKDKFPVAEDYYAGCLSLPLFPAMIDEDVAKVIDVVSGLM